MEGETFIEPLWQGWRRADWIVGTPSRISEDAGYQLSSLYALSLSWGDVAAEYVASQGKAREIHNFENSWLAQTYELSERKQTWEQLGNRLIRDVPEMVVPEGYSVLTCAVDTDFAVWSIETLDELGLARFQSVQHGRARGPDRARASGMKETG